MQKATLSRRQAGRWLESIYDTSRTTTSSSSSCRACCNIAVRRQQQQQRRGLASSSSSSSSSSSESSCNSSSGSSGTGLSEEENRKLRPIYWHYFDTPVRYTDGLRLQEALVARRARARSAAAGVATKNDNDDDAGNEDRNNRMMIASTDILLLLEHSPVYTTGRREVDEQTMALERSRLEPLGADYVPTMRGGQTTYHGPGQLVGYPILDTSTMNLSTRCYVQRISDFLENLVMNHYGIPLVLPPPQVGTYPTSTSKIGSIGIQIRHRITSHGFALNVTDEVKFWFDQIVACGSSDIKATSIESELRKLQQQVSEEEQRRSSSSTTLQVRDVVPPALEYFAKTLRRELRPLEEAGDPELVELVTSLAREAE